MAKNDFQYAGWNSYTLQCGTITTLIAVWHVALESWQWIHQVAAPCNVTRGCGITCHWIRPNVRHIWILHLVSISTTSPQSTLFCTSLRNFIQIGPFSAEKNDMSFFKMADLSHLGFYGPIMGSLKSPCATSYRSSIETMLVFEKIAFFAIWRQTDRQTNRWTGLLHESALAVASGGLINKKFSYCWDSSH